MDLAKYLEQDEIKWGKLVYKKDRDGKHRLYDKKNDEFIDIKEKGMFILEKQAERSTLNHGI